MKQRQGTLAWFQMAVEQMRQAAAEAAIPPDLTASLVERYTDGTELRDGLVQGIRVDIEKGAVSFRIGVQPDERADVVVELTAAAARLLNSLYSTNPNYAARRKELLSNGEMRVTGDPADLGEWMDAAHDPIVERTS